MVAKISELTLLHQTTLLKSEQHKENSILTGLGRGTTPWVLLGPEWTWIMGFLSHFLISHASWLLPIVFELLCRNLLREQYQNSWFSVRWRAEVSWRCWSNLKNGKPAALVMFERMEATVPLFISEIRHDVGSTSNRYTAHSLSASVSDFMGPRTDCLQLFQCWPD